MACAPFDLRRTLAQKLESEKNRQLAAPKRTSVLVVQRAEQRILDEALGGHRVLAFLGLG
jgi:hypothetical protein